MRSNDSLVLYLVTTNHGKQSIFHHSRSRYYNLDHVSVYTHARNDTSLEINDVVVASTLQGLVDNYALQDIFTIDVTKLAFPLSLVAN